MLRSILAVLAAVVAGFVLIILGDTLNHAIYPTPAGLDISNESAFHSFLASAPAGMFALLFASWMVAAFGTGFIA
ncbi:MAG TPA: hypothetical protein VIT92_13765, partial [Burkholderiaceae bacterium]